MEYADLISLEQISNEDWESTPASVKGLVEEWVKRVTQLESEVRQLRSENQLLLEQVKRTWKRNRLLCYFSFGNKQCFLVVLLRMRWLESVFLRKLFSINFAILN